MSRCSRRSTIRRRRSTTILQLPDVTRTLHRGSRRLYVLVDRVQVGVRCPVSAEAGAALLNLTGSFEHVMRLAGARRRAWLDARAAGAAWRRGSTDRRHRRGDLRGARPAADSGRDPRGHGRDRRRAVRPPARARLERRHPRRPPHAYRLERRPRFGGDDGRNGARASGTSTSPSPITRPIPVRHAT